MCVVGRSCVIDRVNKTLEMRTLSRYQSIYFYCSKASAKCQVFSQLRWPLNSRVDNEIIKIKLEVFLKLRKNVESSVFGPFVMLSPTLPRYLPTLPRYLPTHYKRNAVLYK